MDSLRPDPERDVWAWDDEIKGFGVRVKPSGHKGYLVQYRAQGRTRRFTLGAHGKLTPEQARRLAQKKLGEVAEGGDPAEERRRGRQALTVRELAKRYMDEHAIPKKKPASTFRDERLLERFILPALGNRKIKTISRTDVAQLHHKIGQETPTQANRTLAVLSKMLTLAIRWGLYEGENPCRHIERFKESKRERYLNQDELARLGAAIHKAEGSKQISPTAAAALRLLTLTGMRLGEVLSLQWAWIDSQRGVIFFPDSKTGQKVTALGGPALELLDNLPRTAGNPHVFPGQKFGRSLQSLNVPWRLVRDKAGLKGVRLHDLRHTHASVGAAAGLSLPVIGALLGHTQAATTQRYAHLAQDPVKQAADQVASLIDSAMRAPAKRKVVDIYKGKKGQHEE
ncbi:integrase [Desulfoferula mesophila]|uniref:Integrase n=1 Tax=Desulfoferula mesophila TaxID=3058419 RepID=A0AAU9F3R9_9BACT|nr:integrase [Desulfoferula mesophilus]